MHKRPLLSLLALLVAPSLATAQTCPGDCNRDGKVTAAEIETARKIKNGKLRLDSCPAADVDGNGRISAAEITAAERSKRLGCPKPSPTATATTVPTATNTPAPAAAAALDVAVENRASRILTATLWGQRLAGPTSAARTTYGPFTVAVAPDGISVPFADLAPGEWLHHIDVTETGQRQAKRSLLIAGSRSDLGPGTWTLFPTVLRVNRTDDDGDGTCSAECTLRDAIDASVQAAQPALIQFDHAALAGSQGALAVTRNAPLVLRVAGTVVDGTDLTGNPSPLGEIGSRSYPTSIRLQAPNLAPRAGLDCPCTESPGGSLRVAAEDVRLVGLSIERALAAEGTICCGDQDLVAFDAGSRGSGIATSRLDGGAAALRSAEVPSGSTRPATGKDCVDASGTGATQEKPIDVEHTEIRFCHDRGVKSQAGWLRLRHNWIHHNLRGGVFAQSPVEGVIESHGNLLEENGINCPSADPDACGTQQVARAGASEISAQGARTRIFSGGDVARNGALQGFFFEDGSAGRVEDAYVCGIRRSSGGKGFLIQRSSGLPGDVVIRGSSAVYNDDAGVKVRDRVGADLGSAADRGLNAFVGNGAGTRRNVVNAMDAPAPLLAARGNSWEHCYGTASVADSCDIKAIGDLDTNNSLGATDKVDVAGAVPHQSSAPPHIDAIEPSAAAEGTVVRLLGSDFDAISGHTSYAAGDCRTLAEHNSCAPLAGTCVEFLVAGEWVPARDVLAVTPTSVTVRTPFTCTEPVLVRSRRRVRGGGEVASVAVPFCLPQRFAEG